MNPILSGVDPEGFYKPKQTWTLLGISKATLYRWDEEGLINHYLHESNRRYYKGSDIIRCHNAFVKVTPSRR